MKDKNDGDLTDTKIGLVLIGPPGIGKTAWAKKYVKDAEEVVVVDLCSHLPEDLLGIPQVITDPQTGDVYTKWAPPDWLWKLSKNKLKDKKGVLVLDDIASASPTVQVAVMSLLLERRVGSLELGDNVKIILTANHRADKAGASSLPSSLINRVEVIDFIKDFSQRFGETLFENWQKWWISEGLPIEVLSFLKFRPQFFIQSPAEKGGQDYLGRFATPRSWEYVGRVLKELKRRGDLIKGENNEDIMGRIVGFIGVNVASEFVSFLRYIDYFESINLENILKNPSCFEPPTEPDRKVALMGAIVTVLLEKLKKNQQSRDELGEWSIDKVLNVLARIAGKEEREYFMWGVMLIVTGLKDYPNVNLGDILQTAKKLCKEMMEEKTERKVKKKVEKRMAISEVAK